MATGITKSNLNLRGGPGPQNPVLQVLPKGSSISILETLGDWLHVGAPDGTSGYVASAFVDVQTITPTPPIDPIPIDPVPVDKKIVSTKRLVPSGPTLNVRSSPTISTHPDNKIEGLTSGAILIPLEDDASVTAKVGSSQVQGLWLHVRTPSGKEGYVAAWLVAYQDTTGGSDLYSYIASIPTDETPIPQGYADFWAQRVKLGLPDPFDVSPTQLGYPALTRMPVNGFGPNTFAFQNWQAYYKNVGGMHNGLDHIVPLGTPLQALSDGVIVGTQANWQFLGKSEDKSIILWCFLPDSQRDGQGRRLLSNVLVAYGHLSDNTLVKRHDVVKAGQVIGLSGRPFGETGNDHLHLEVHLLSGDKSLPHPSGRTILTDFKRPQPFANYSPFNPLLFFSERLVRYHLHQGKKIGFGSSTTYPSSATLAAAGLGNWPPLDFFTMAFYQYGSAPIWTVKNTPWPIGIYDLPGELARIANFEPFVPYPSDFL